VLETGFLETDWIQHIILLYIESKLTLQTK